jgi:nucleoside-diphosphate-sugar epimerase
VDANLYAFKNYPKFRGGAFDVGTCNAHTFEKVMELIGCKYRVLEKYYAVPQNYQFYTRAYKSRLMKGWEAKFSLEAGILAYLQYLKNKPNDSTNNP